MFSHSDANFFKRHALILFLLLTGQKIKADLHRILFGNNLSVFPCQLYIAAVFLQQFLRISLFHFGSAGLIQIDGNRIGRNHAAYGGQRIPARFQIGKAVYKIL